MIDNLTIVIPAFNEEHALPALKRALPVDCKIVLYDNFSTDSTAELAESYGWDVFQFQNCGFAEDPQLVSLFLSRLFTDWVYICRADEIPSPSFVNQLRTLADINYDALRVPRHNILNGKVCTAWGVDYETPVFKSSVFIVTGNLVRIGYPGVFIPETRFKVFSPRSSVYINHHQDYTISSFVNAINRYSSNTLSGLLSASSIPRSPEDGFLLFTMRRLRLFVYKSSILLLLSLFVSPLIRFLWHFVYRKGFLSGYVGFLASVMMFFEEALIILKALSLRLDWDL